MESVEIVISGDHERCVIGICGYNTLIAVIICRPWFLQSILRQLSDKIAGSERKSYCVGGVRVEIEMLLWVQIQRQDVRSLQIKMSISCSRRENRFSQQKNSDENKT